MSDDAVREKLRLYADDVAPAQLPSFGGVTARRRRRRTQQLLSATSAVVVVALVVVLAVVLGRSTGSQASGLGSELVGGKWSLASITTSGAAWKAPAHNGFSLSFSSSGYTGNDSCNGASGAVSYGHDTVHLGSGAMTELGCPGDDRARMQDAFRLLIDKDLPVVVSDDTLTITAGQTVFALTRVQPVAPVDLSKALPGTTWDLVSIGTTGKDVSSSTPVAAITKPSVAFHAKDYVANDGCNASNGPASYTTTTVTLGYVASTALSCPDQKQDIGAAYGKVLTGTVKPTLVGDTLTIANATQSLVFSRETPASRATGLEQNLTANNWRLVSVGDTAGTLDVSAQGWTLAFTATSYTAQTQCFDSFGAVSYDQGSLTMSPDGSSGRCEESSLDKRVSKAYGIVLTGTVHYALTPRGLTLSARGTQLVYVVGKGSGAVPGTQSAAPTSAVPGMKARLIDSTWKLKTLKTATDNWHAIEGSAATLTFTDSAYQVSDGCEGEGHGVVYDEAAALITIDRSGEGMGSACSLAAEPPKGSVPPKAYFDAFFGTLHVSLTGNTLTLTRTGMVLTFSKVGSSPGPSASQRSGGALQTSVEGFDWRVTSLTEKGVTTQVPATPPIRLYATPGGYAFDAGCQITSGSVSYTNDSVLLTSGGWVGTICTTTDLESRIQQAFGTVLLTAKVSVLGPTMTMSSGDTTLTFDRHTAKPTPSPTPLQTALVGSTWQLTKYNAQGTWVTPAASLKATLRFASTGFDVSDGCNTISGYAAYSATAVTMRPIGSTDAPCVDTDAGVTSVVSALDGEVSMSVKGDTLTVDAHDKNVVYARDPVGPPYLTSLPFFPPP